MMLTLALGKGETDFQAVGLILLVNVFDKGRQILSRRIGLSGFFGFVRHGNFLFMRNVGFRYDYSIRSDLSATGGKISAERTRR